MMKYCSHIQDQDCAVRGAEVGPAVNVHAQLQLGQPHKVRWIHDFFMLISCFFLHAYFFMVSYAL